MEGTTWAYQGIHPLWQYSSEDFALPYIIQEWYEVLRIVFSTTAIHTIGDDINVLIQ